MPMVHHNAKKIETNPSNMPYVVAHILLTTKDVQCSGGSTGRIWRIDKDLSE